MDFLSINLMIFSFKYVRQICQGTNLVHWQKLAQKHTGKLSRKMWEFRPNLESRGT